MSWTYFVDGSTVTLRWEGSDIITESASGDGISRGLSGLPYNPDIRDMAFRAIEKTENNWQSAETTRKAALAGLEQFEEVES